MIWYKIMIKIAYNSRESAAIELPHPFDIYRLVSIKCETRRF